MKFHFASSVTDATSHGSPFARALSTPNLAASTGRDSAISSCAPWKTAWHLALAGVAMFKGRHAEMAFTKPGGCQGLAAPTVLAKQDWPGYPKGCTRNRPLETIIALCSCTLSCTLTSGSETLLVLKTLKTFAKVQAFQDQICRPVTFSRLRP